MKVLKYLRGAVIVSKPSVSNNRIDALMIGQYSRQNQPTIPANRKLRFDSILNLE